MKNRPKKSKKTKAKTFDGIIISGDTAFIKRTEKALFLLATKSKSFSLVKKYLGAIKQAQKSAINVYCNVPTFEVADPTSTHSIIWYASSIAHDAYHSLLYSQARKKTGKEPNPRAWAYTQAERKCLEFEEEVLKELSADTDTISYIRKLKKNPTYWKNYENRDW